MTKTRILLALALLGLAGLGLAVSSCTSHRQRYEYLNVEHANSANQPQSPDQQAIAILCKKDQDGQAASTPGSQTPQQESVSAVQAQTEAQSALAPGGSNLRIHGNWPSTYVAQEVTKLDVAAPGAAGQPAPGMGGMGMGGGGMGSTGAARVQDDWGSADEVWVIVRPEGPAPADDPDRPGCGAMLACRASEREIPLPLRHTAVSAEVVGPISTVRVTQQFENPFDTKIEAVYVFPLPHDAAVNDFLMTVGNRTIRGIIRRRQEAERVYQQARSQGHTASLLTQERPNISTQKVANIEPGRSIDVDIRYFNTQDSQERVRVQLSPNDLIPNKDFVLRFRVAGDRIKSALFTHQDGHERTFCLVVHPPADLAILRRCPMEMIFVLDCSGSMNGQPLAKSKEAAKRALRMLGPDDTFLVINFSNTARQLGQAPVVASQENIQRALDYLDSLRSEGGTMMIEGIRAALDFPHDPRRLRLVSFMTDGYIGNETEIMASRSQSLCLCPMAYGMTRLCRAAE